MNQLDGPIFLALAVCIGYAASAWKLVGPAAADILPQYGIREPLYATALKYAGVELTPDMRPSYLPELKLSEEQKQQVKQWLQIN